MIDHVNHHAAKTDQAEEPLVPERVLQGAVENESQCRYRPEKQGFEWRT